MKRTHIRMTVASLGFALLQAGTSFAAGKTAPNLARSRDLIGNASNKKFFDSAPLRLCGEFNV